jgi:formyltetrahydrofolate-dependent phosphoribosylglycinamide formyltransferase
MAPGPDQHLDQHERPVGERPRLVVMVSGAGTNLQAILDATGQAPDGAERPGPRLDAEVVLVIANRADAYALTRAEAAGVPTTVLPHAGRDRAEYDTELAYEARIVGADLVVLAGWNRLLTHNFLVHHRVVNLHPAKPGAFPGLGAIERAHEAWVEGRITSGGVMVHFVPDEGVDSGPVIAWEEIPFVDGDTLASYEARVHEVEHRLLVEAVGTVLDEQRTARR